MPGFFVHEARMWNSQKNREGGGGYRRKWHAQGESNPCFRRERAAS